LPNLNFLREKPAPAAPSDEGTTDLGDQSYSGGVRVELVTLLGNSVIEGIRHALQNWDKTGAPMANVQEIVLGIQQGQYDIISQVATDE